MKGEIMDEIKTVLVTGGGGYVGAVLVPKLLDAGYTVKVVDLYIYGKDVFDGIADKDRLTGIEGDIRKTTSKVLRLLNRVLKNLGSLEQWPILRSEGTVITEAGLQYDMLLDITNGSDLVSISSFDSSGFTFQEKHKYWSIQFAASDTPLYRIVEVQLPTRVKLNRVWNWSQALKHATGQQNTDQLLDMERFQFWNQIKKRFMD